MNSSESEQRSGGFLRRHGRLIVLVLIALLVASPYWYLDARVVVYIKFVNPKLKAHPDYQDVWAWKTLHGPILLSFSGSVRTEEQLAALNAFIAGTHPPEPYTNGVFVLHDAK